MKINFSPAIEEDALTKVSITGSDQAVALATKLIKMAVLHVRAGVKTPSIGVYLEDK